MTEEGNPGYQIGSDSYSERYLEQFTKKSSSKKMGEHLFTYKEKLLAHPSVADARGWGLCMTLELVESKESGEYFPRLHSTFSL